MSTPIYEGIVKASVRVFDVEHNGCEIPELDAYTLLFKLNGEYKNVFDMDEECNVYERLPYSNSTMSGVDFGTKIRLAYGKEEDGLCYIVETREVAELKGVKNASLDDIYRMVFKSKDFYLQRLDLLSMFPKMLSEREKARIIKEDTPKREKFLAYLEGKEKEKTYKKEEK